MSGPTTTGPEPMGLARATRETDLATWAGLFAASTLLMGVGTPPIPIVAALMACVATLIISVRFRAGVLAIVVLAGLGIWLRWSAPYGGWSDVLSVVQAAATTVLAGGNPYGHGFAESLPPGAPYAYGPIALLWYLPLLGDPRKMELLVTTGILIVLALRGRPLGLAVYAMLAPLLVTAGDGSNDSSAGLLILVALLASQRSPIGGALLLAIAAAFKPYAAAWLPPLIGYGWAAGGVRVGIGVLGAFALGSLATWGVAVWRWGAGSILKSFRDADALHQVPYYSLAWVTGGLGIPESGWQLLRLVLGAGTALASLVTARYVPVGDGDERRLVVGVFRHTSRSFIVAGAAIFVVTLFAGWWSTFAYIGAVAPVVCWHLDDWLGLGGSRVRWPGDPVARITAAADRRFPVLRPWDDAAA